MAKVKQPHYSLQARGSADDWQPWKQPMGHHMISGAPDPRPCPFVYQIWQTLYDVIYRWRTFTRNQKDAWKPIAHRLRTSPYHAFLTTNLRRARVGLEPIDTP